MKYKIPKITTVIFILVINEYAAIICLKIPLEQPFCRETNQESPNTQGVSGFNGFSDPIMFNTPTSGTTVSGVSPWYYSDSSITYKQQT